MAEESTQKPAEQKTERKNKPEPTAQQPPQGTEESESSQETSVSGFFSPEAVIMVSLSLVIDLISLIPAINIISDVLGLVIIGPWMFFRTGALPERPTRPGKTKAPTKNVGQKILRRFGLTALLELIPVVSMIPWWTITVWNELKNS